MGEADSRILDFISSPHDLHCLTNEELSLLASEIRDQIIDTTSKRGGHVASSLGAVEIILAVHSVIDAPKDKFVFDVGHQSYAHKLVTGRLGQFDTLRTFGGISGFPKPSESVYDVHPSGHASDSLSVASGIAKAKVMNGTDERIVTLIGDAALAGGMAFEALNYIGSQQLPMVIILNDNEMSISRNVGALMKHLGNLRATPYYRNTRESLQDFLEQSKMGNAFVEFGRRMKDSTKHMFIPESMIYEQLGIVCTPPIDGNSVAQVKEMLELVLPMDAPVLIHAVTKKGAGYKPAEEDPERFHGIGAFDPVTAKDVSHKTNKTFTEVFGHTLVEEAHKDGRIVAMTAAMEGGTGLKEFRQQFPKRFVDVGISEEQAVGMAAGLAIEGMKPVVAIYSTFMQRAIDQAIVDVALSNLDVVFALDRAGIVGNDGPTHHGAFDISYMRMIPNMKVVAPFSGSELASALRTALVEGGPFAIRYPRGEVPSSDIESAERLEIGRAKKIRDGKDCAILAWGSCVQTAIEASKILEDQGFEAMVYDMLWAKPLDLEAIRDAAKTGHVATIEDGIKNGGAGMGVLEIMSEERLCAEVEVFGYDDVFASQGDNASIFKELGLDASSIADALIRSIQDQD